VLSVTKIFRFEAAHALFDYQGPCSRIHGHSYELHVQVGSVEESGRYLSGTGILYDFKALKNLVQEAVIRHLDHKLIVSEKFLSKTKPQLQPDSVFVFRAEPSAENLLLFMRLEIQKVLPIQIKLLSLRLWETGDSYAEWLAD